ncbi:unnamed protein product [Phytophthora lilii]|uniref:Unnamed protein product n=1 Tax=Phytophthora lilii TaxID=2077276 RepID=A0A9W6UFL9_9STRA|nr:unnamed protein product [Phytophthora lilii]
MSFRQRPPIPATIDEMANITYLASVPLSSFVPIGLTGAGVATIQKLHKELLAIQSKIQEMEEHDDFSTQLDQGAITRFETIAAEFLAYLKKFYGNSLLYRLAHIDDMKQERRLIEVEVIRLRILFNFLISESDMEKLLQMEDTLQVGEPLPMLETDLPEYVPEYPEIAPSTCSVLRPNELDKGRDVNNHEDNEHPVMRESQHGAIATSTFYTDVETIVKYWIPHEDLIVQEFISSGAFGEVYKGVYNGETVAVKTMADVDTFMKEIKMATAMNHPNIVQFIGVACDAQEKFCFVMEYMDGGDLRTLLNLYKEQHHPIGFDCAKIKIALHVAHALAYLHYFDVPIIHRDLKSNNILLNQELGAKLTDFGVSRERVVGPMTAEVGTSLWMAPEVMIGNPYDEKADMFSFGVVLSELSMHSLPYSHAKVRSGSNRELVVLHRVAIGDLRVEFSRNDQRPMIELGLACVSMDPKKRPTAAEAVYKLCDILIKEASG